MRERLPTISPAAYARVTLVALAALSLIVLTGAAVRLTGSGLGCPDWPKCYGQAVAPLETHAIIEYGNRLISGLVGLAAVAAGALAFRRRPFRRDLAVLGVVLPVGVVAQAVLGGFTVRNHLAPGFVMGHFALSMLILRFKRPGVELDLGGYGKGYAIERAVELLRENGITSALLHGGTISVSTIVRHAPGMGGTGT